MTTGILVTPVAFSSNACSPLRPYPVPLLHRDRDFGQHVSLRSSLVGGADYDIGPDYIVGLVPRNVTSFSGLVCFRQRKRQIGSPSLYLPLSGLSALESS